MKAPPDEGVGVTTASGAALSGGSTKLFGAKLFFLGAGLLQQVLLPNTLGLAGYGLFSRVLAPMNVVNNVAVGASLQNASRATAAGTPSLGSILRVQVALAVTVALALAAAAPLIASFQSSPAIVAPLRVGALLCGLYVLYATLVGVLNGRQRFAAQASLDVTAATLRTAGLVVGGIVGAKTLGSGVLGAVAGTVVAGASMLVIATVLVRPSGLARPRTGETALVLRSIAALAGAQLVMNTLLQIDIVLLGRVFAVRGVASDEADRAIGVYRSCQLYSLLPYQLVASISLALFPLVAKVHAEGPVEALQTLVRRGLRLGIVLAALLVGVIVAIPGPLLRLTFGAHVASLGVVVLRPLAGAQALLVVGALASTVLVALGKAKHATLAGLAGLAVLASGILIVGPGPDALRGMALWLAAAFGTQLLVAFGLLLRAVPACVPLATLARAALVAAAAAMLPSEAAGHRAAAIALAPAAALGALALLALTGEWTRTDVAELAAALARRRRSRP